MPVNKNMPAPVPSIPVVWTPRSIPQSSPEPPDMDLMFAASPRRAECKDDVSESGGGDIRPDILGLPALERPDIEEPAGDTSSEPGRSPRSFQHEANFTTAPPANMQALIQGQERLQKQTNELVQSVAAAQNLMMGQQRLEKQLEMLSKQMNGVSGVRERRAHGGNSVPVHKIPLGDAAEEDLADMEDPVLSKEISELGDEQEDVDTTGDGFMRRGSRLLSMRRNETMAKLHGHGGIYHAAWIAEVVTCTLFTLACMAILAFWARHVNEEAFVNTFFVTAIAAMTYFAKSCHMGDLMFRDQVVPIARYIDWITTTPLMLYELCHIAHAPAHMVFMVIISDLLMLATGMVAAAMPWKGYKVYKQIWFFFSCLFYMLLVVVLQVDVAYKASKQTEVAAQLFDRLKILTIVVWSFYPIIVGMGRAHLGLITKPMEDIALCVLDVMAKLGMEGLIVASCFNGCLGDGGAH
jgi:bacteriorhodopsin